MISFTTNNLATTITITKWGQYQDPYMRNGTPKGTVRDHGISETLTGQGIQDAKKIEEEEEKKFNIFWKAYPNKQGKAVAKKVWMGMEVTEESFEVIMSALTQQKQWSRWTRSNGQFIPMPATWLRGERWNDESLESTSVNPWAF